MEYWETLTNERERYAAYLCSRQWSELREQVNQRSGGMCERCGVNFADAVHHLTYIRKYRERLSDLQAICNACHEFTHGKSQYDPKPEQACSVRMPEGEYTATIVASRVACNSLGKHLELTLRLHEHGDGQTRFAWRLELWSDSASSVYWAQRALSEICRATDVLCPESSASFHGIPFRVYVSLAPDGESTEIWHCWRIEDGLPRNR